MSFRVNAGAFMPRWFCLLVIVAVVHAVDATPASAQPGTPACKRELADNRKRMQLSLQLVTDAVRSPPAERCPAFFRHQDLVTQMRESFARCEPDVSHAATLRNVDEVLDETSKAIDRDCPPSPGMTRINAVFINRIERDKLPKALAAAHRCDAPQRMRIVNEPFESGRIVMLGCKGIDAATEKDSAARNASAKALADEHYAIYLTRDSSGRGASRLKLPVRLADGREADVETVPASGTSPQGRNRIVGNWAPADSSVCRIHAEWTVAAGKAALVLWQEVVDCSKPGAVDFRTILDRR
jgi:hypothetical protein